MSVQSAESTEANLHEVLDEYLAELRAGRMPDREALLARHPDLAPSLLASLRALDFVHGVRPTLEAPGTSSGGEEPTGPGRVLGDFRLRGEIARGGMAVVYEAEQISLGRRVALKVLPFAAVLDPKQLQRFKNEAQAAANLQHPHVVPVYAVGCERGVHYYAMQYVEGQSLAVAIRELRDGAEGAGPRTPLSSHGSQREPAYIRTVAQLGVRVAGALDHAHQLGIVHRDVKPGNVLVDVTGAPWVTDFGLALSLKDVGLTMTGELLGTIRYMSPEQARAKRAPLDHRTDVYSLGATLYEAFTLEPAFPGEDLHRVLQDIASKEPVAPRRLNPAIPRDVETVLLKAMSKDPAARYTTAQEMADDLVRFLENRPIEAKRPGLVGRAAKWGRRHRGLVGAVAAVLLLAVAGLAIGAGLLLREQEQTRSAFVQAEDNLALALQALDQIYMDEVEGNPKIREGLPPDLLEKGLRFYEAFARKNAHLQRAGAELGIAYHRAGLILRRLGQEERAKEALDRAISTHREAIRLGPLVGGPHLLLGNALLDRGDFDAAIQEYREAIRLKPKEAVPHYNLGNALYDKGDFDAASQEYREAIRLKSDYALAHYNLGNALSKMGNPGDAIPEYREAIRLAPDRVGAHGNLALALCGTGDPEAAILECRETIRLEPDNSEAHYNLGNLLYNKGDFDAAIQEYREAIRLKPDDSSAHGNLGITLKAKGQLDAAIQEHLEAIRLKPDDATDHNNLGSSLFAKGEFDAAVQAFREAIRLKPDLAMAHFNLGNALRAKGELDAAVQEYREAIRLTPDLAEAHLNLGVALFDKRDLEGAILEGREAIRLKPDYAEAHVLLSRVLLDQRDLEGAIRASREAIRLKPDLAKAHASLGRALFEKRDLKGAIQALREATRLEPDNAQAHGALGDGLLSTRDLDGAIQEYREAIRLKPEYAEAHGGLGTALMGRRDLEGAIHAFREAIRLKPGVAEMHGSLGDALRVKDPDGAIAAFREVVRLKPDLALGHASLGAMLLTKGDWNGAVLELREAIRLLPDFLFAHYQLALALNYLGDWDGVVQANREIIRLRPDEAVAHTNIGLALSYQARFRDALPWFRRGLELGSNLLDARGLALAEREAELEGSLEKVASGEMRPRDTLDRLAFAEMLYVKSLYPDATRMYAEAFAEDPALAAQLSGVQTHRFNAAGTALKAARAGTDAAAWRGRALEWLRADLAARRKEPSGAAAIESWKYSPDFADVRDRLDDLPEQERAAWRGLWAAVDEALASARQPPR